MDEWREDGSDPGAPVRAKKKEDGTFYGVKNGRFVPAFVVEFENLPDGVGIPGDRRLRWTIDPAHWLFENELARWARPTDPGDRLFAIDWEREVECRFQLFVQAIFQDDVNILNLLHEVNFVDPRLGFPLRSDTPAGQLDVFYFDRAKRRWLYRDEFRPYKYTTYCTTFGKPAAAAWFAAKENSAKFAHVYNHEEATATPEDFFRPIEDFPGP